MGTEGEQKPSVQDILWHWSCLGGLSVIYEEAFQRRKMFYISFSHYFVEKKIIYFS